MNAIKYETDDGILIRILVWALILGVLILAPYVISVMTFKKNAELTKRIERLELAVENIMTNQVQTIEK